jgi:hypothetical protein
MGQLKANQRRSPSSVTNKDPAQFLPTGVQKSYFMLSRAAHAVLNNALQKYRTGQSESILVRGYWPAQTGIVTYDVLSLGALRWLIGLRVMLNSLLRFACLWEHQYRTGSVRHHSLSRAAKEDTS